MTNYAGSQNNLTLLLILRYIQRSWNHEKPLICTDQSLGENRLCFWQAEAARTQNTCSTVLHWIIYLTQRGNITPAYSITNLLCLFFSNPLPLSLPLCHFDEEQTHSAKHSYLLLFVPRWHPETQRECSRLSVVTVCVWIYLKHGSCMFTLCSL